MTYWVGLAGDWHGDTRWARAAIQRFSEAGIQRVFHLGDFGLGWPGGWGQYINEVAGACIKHNVFIDVIPGNHENYDWIRSRLLSQAPEDGIITITGKIRVLPRNYRESTYYGRTILALGGAPSIDFPNRIEGRSWWKDEMLTLEDVEKAASDGHADVMLCHDSPDGGTDEVQRIIDDANPMWSDAGLAYAREGRLLMNIAVEGVRPKVFAHGHFHVAGEKQTEHTKFLSLADNGKRRNLAILDIETLDHDWILDFP